MPDIIVSIRNKKLLRTAFSLLSQVIGYPGKTIWIVGREDAYGRKLFTHHLEYATYLFGLESFVVVGEWDSLQWPNGSAAKFISLDKLPSGAKIISQDEAAKMVEQEII